MSNDNPLVSRRKLFLTLLPGGVAAVGLIGGAAAMMTPQSARFPGRVKRVCRLSEMDIGGQVTLNDNVLVVRDHAGLHALSLVCTHLGCGVTRHEQGFQCHCHGSLFDDQGRALRGPATEPLHWYSVVLRDGWVLVDLDQRVSVGTVTPA